MLFWEKLVVPASDRGSLKATLLRAPPQGRTVTALPCLRKMPRYLLGGPMYAYYRFGVALLRLYLRFWGVLQMSQLADTCGTSELSEGKLLGKGAT